MKTFEEWYQYVLSFYGKGGLYDMGATKRQVAKATDILLKRIGWSFVADSVDREEVRDTRDTRDTSLRRARVKARRQRQRRRVCCAYHMRNCSTSLVWCDDSSCTS